MRITVSELLVRYLERLGIDTLFGIPGAHILPVYDQLQRSSIRTILTKHEQGAAFMAGGYARASGRIGACIATAGPGATNLVTGIANAYADHQPLLAITGETSTHIFGKGGLQESSGEGGSIDQVTLFRGITRYHKLIERSDYLPQVLHRATRTLTATRPGPVLLSLPFNVQLEAVDSTLLDHILPQPGSLPRRPRLPPLSELEQRLRQARCPVIIAGYGATHRHGSTALTALSQRHAIPVATSLKAKGAIDEHAPLALGTLGVTSDGRARRYLIDHADLLLFLGASFNERTSYLWDPQLLNGKQIIQIDHDPEQLERLYHADLALYGDIPGILNALLDRLHDMPPKQPPPAAPGSALHWSSGSDHDQPAPASAAKPPVEKRTPPAAIRLIEYLFNRLGEHFPSDIMLFDDNIIFAQNFLRISSANRYYPNSGISSLGHAIPAAIGARLASDRTAFAILGDGGFQMCAMELMTAVNYQIPLNILLLNNGTMGLIRKNQQQHYQRRFIDCDFINPDFATLAQAFGIHHYRIEQPAAIDQLLAQADLHHAINLIEIPIDREIYPNYQSGR